MALFSVFRRKRWRALVGLSAYERENPPKLRERDEPAEPPNLVAGASIAGTLLLFFFITVAGYPTVQWFERGSADADRILLGELWRTVTALTLHANLAHALLAPWHHFFSRCLSTLLGPGLGSALVLACWRRRRSCQRPCPRHGSRLGQSLYVGFGAVGMLGGLGLARRGRKKYPGAVPGYPSPQL